MNHSHHIFIIHTRKRKRWKRGGVGGGGGGGDVVRRLTEDLQHKAYHVYFDNYFSSISRMISLLKLILYAVGTLRADRKGFPSDLKVMAKKGSKTEERAKLDNLKM